MMNMQFRKGQKPLSNTSKTAEWAFSEQVLSQKHQFKLPCTQKNTFMRAKESGSEITAHGCNTEVRKDALKRAEGTVSNRHVTAPASLHSVAWTPMIYTGEGE